MEKGSKPHMDPLYMTDKRQLVQITEQIIDGEKVITETPLSAYQTIHTTQKQSRL